MKSDLPVLPDGHAMRDQTSAQDIAGRVRPSKAVVGLIERVRSRFGVGVELLDDNLLPVVPLVGAEFSAVLANAPEVRGQAQFVLNSGRSQLITTPGGPFHLHAVRAQGRGRKCIAVLALRTAAADTGPRASDIASDAWLDLLRSTIETDLNTGEGVREERLEARRATAALRFLAQMSSSENEHELARAMIHAAAVWFDVDARLYRRSLLGDFLLHTSLPGIKAGGSQPLVSILPLPPRVRRIAFQELPSDLQWSTGDVLILPLTTDGDEEWVLVLGGTLPPSAETVFSGLARTLGARLDALAQHRLQRVREAFHRAVTRTAPPEQVAVHCLRQLLDVTGASRGAMTLHGNGEVRRLASFGHCGHLPALPTEPLYAPDQFIYPMPIDDHRGAVIELASDGTFTVAAARAVAAAGQILHGWVVATDSTTRWRSARAANSDFARRITEELERAKRFDLGLAMVLIDLSGEAAVDDSTLLRVTAAVRQELRGSDVLGTLDDGRIAAVLVHTDSAAVTSVLPRLRRRVADVTHTLGAARARLGPAVLSDACRTTSALLSQAADNLEPVA
jgi:GGDEF domain-containing protein